MRKISFVSIFLVLLLFIASSGCTSTIAQGRTRGFETPEACAQALLEALRAGDHHAFLDCYAIPEMARSFNFEASYETVRSYNFLTSMLPPIDSFSIAANEAKLRRMVLDQFVMTNVLFDEGDSAPGLAEGFTFSAKETPAEQVSKVLQKRIAWGNLKLQKTLDPSLVFDNYLNLAHYRSKVDGAEYGLKGDQDLMLVLDLDGQTLYMSSRFVRFDEGWLVYPYPPPLSSTLGLYGLRFLGIADEKADQEIQMAVPTKGLEARVGKWSQTDRRFVLYDQVSWDSSAADVIACLGEHQAWDGRDADGAGNIVSDVPIAWDEVKIHSVFSFSQNQLTSMAQDIVHLSGRENILYAELRRTLNAAYGEATLRDASQVMPYLKSLTDAPDKEMHDLEAAPWQAWRLSDQSTIVLLISHKRVSIFYMNTDRIRPQ